MPVLKKLEEKIKELQNSFDSISNERKELLNKLAKYISGKISNRKEVNLIFICTHNSRRSHISQVWAQTAAEFYNIPNIKCYSGGTEATAFNPKAIKALDSIGFEIEQMYNNENPVYKILYSNENDPLGCFSKVYSDKFNPQKEFAAIMTCSDADENCPVVFGAEERFPIRYNDPKEFDNTKSEIKEYMKTVELIGREMIYCFSSISASMKYK